MSQTLSAAITGATAGAALGPVGMAAGALLGVAPGLLAAFGVHLGSEAGARSIMSAIQGVTGKQAPDVDDMAGLTADQRVTLQVRLAEIDAAAEKSERDATLAELVARLGDVAGARGQTVSLAQTGSKIAWGAPVVSVLVVGMFGVILALIATRAVPSDAKDLMNIMLGTLGASFGAVVQYWVGSASGSKDKDATIAALSVRAP